MFENKRLAAIAAVSIALAGCESAPIRAVSDSYQEMVYGWRSKGEKQTGSIDAVRREFGCNENRRFALHMEESEVLPRRVHSGREINHRFVYSACTPNDGIEPHPLVRRILHRGRIVFEDRDRRFELKPGRWTVDAFVGIPPAAAPGVYVLEVEIELRKGSSRKLRNEFDVVLPN
jgi:hypothetical protein